MKTRKVIVALSGDRIVDATSLQAENRAEWEKHHRSYGNSIEVRELTLAELLVLPGFNRGQTLVQGRQAGLTGEAATVQVEKPAPKFRWSRRRTSGWPG